MMKKVTRWMRILHRWISIPFLLSVIAASVYLAIRGLETTLPVLLTALPLALIVLLTLTGSFMLVQYYVSRFRRAPVRQVKIARSRKKED